MTSTFSLEREHAELLHEKFYRPPSCTECWPDGPPTVQRPPEPHLTPPVQAPVLARSGVEGWESLGEAITRIQARRQRPVQTVYGPDEVIEQSQLPWCAACKGFRHVKRSNDLRPGEPGFGVSLPCPVCFVEINTQRLRDALPELFRDWSFDTFEALLTTDAQRDVLAAGRELVADPRQPWAFFSGPPGMGKSGLAVSILDAAIRQLHRAAMFRQSGEILSKIRSTYRTKAAMDDDEFALLETLKDADLLVIDDLGSETDTDWASAELFQILTGRHDRNRQTIITSNWNLKQLAERIGLPAVSRIQEMTVSSRYRIDFTGLPYLRHDR